MSRFRRSVRWQQEGREGGATERARVWGQLFLGLFRKAEMDRAFLGELKFEYDRKGAQNCTKLCTK